MMGKWHFVVLCALFALWNKAHWLWLGLIIFCLIYLGLIKRKAPFTLLIFLVSAFIWFSFSPSKQSSLLNNPNFLEQEQLLHGEIVTNPEFSGNEIEFILREETTNEKVFVKINTENSGVLNKTYQIGAFCEIRGSPQLPQVARNPGNFDYRNYLESKGIYVELHADIATSSCEGKNILAIPYLIRGELLSFLASTYNEDTVQWIEALLFGNKDFLSDELIEQFQYWNLSHILAISGLHVGLIIGFLYFFLTSVLGQTKEKSKIILMIILPIYALFAGSQPPVLRAVLMAEILFFTSFFQKKWPVTDVISITALVFILLDPYLVDQMSFQFSFIVTFALILSKNILFRHRSFIWNSVYISFISQIVLIPLQLLSFYYISPLSLFSNLFFVPYFSVFVIPLCLIATILSWVPYFPNVVNYIFQVHNELMAYSTHWLDSMQFIWVIGKISAVGVILYFLFYYFFLKRLEQIKPRKAFLFGVMMVVLLIAEQLKAYFNPYGTITMLDVGQGDTIVIELPYREAVLIIDAAKEIQYPLSEESDEVNNTAKYQIQPFLWSKGIKNIDHLIITHDDLDHMGSLDYLVNQFHVGTIYYNPYTETEITYKNKQILSDGDILKIGGYNLYVLSPSSKSTNKNDNSIVLFGNFGKNGFLFTGDISANMEEKIVQKYKNLKVDVLKVAHHGSKNSTSDTFLGEIDAKVALISAGKFNTYGHPSKETIERLKEVNINIYRTDQNGAITYKFNNTNGTFYPWIP